MTQKTGSSTILDPIVDSFVRHAHQVVQLGHKQLMPKSLAQLDETAITGKLVDAIKEALDASDAPRWRKHFRPVDDEPVTVGNKLGKHRPRIDVTIYSTSIKPARFFRFEAKRLKTTTHPASKYLGEDGMLALITGHYGQVEWAGMIGYVQSGTCSEWADKIKAAVALNPKKYLAKNPVTFEELDKRALKGVFYEAHKHKKHECCITHMLLIAS